LKIEGKTLNEPVVFKDIHNDRFFQHRFDKVGTYVITNYDEESAAATFSCKVHIQTAERHLQMTILKNSVLFGVLTAILVGGSAVVTEVLFSFAGFVPDKEYDDGQYNEKATHELTQIMKSHSSVTIVLAILIICVAPLMALFNVIKPAPLTSYGRGYDYLVHTRVRAVMGSCALVCFGIVLWGWNR
jgi:hypothetical protein